MPIPDPRFTQAHADAREADFVDSRRIVRREYRKAILVFAVAITATLLLGLVGTQSPIQLALGLLAIKLAGGLMVAFIALLIAERLFLGDVGPKGLAALRLAGALAGAQATWLVLGGVPLYGIALASLAYAALIVWLFDVDFVEAILLAVISWVLVIVVVAGLIFYIQSALQ